MGKERGQDVVQPSFETRAKPLKWYSSVSHSRGAPQAALSPISAHNRVRSHTQERGPRRDFLEKEDRLSAYFLSLDLCEGLELPAINANTFARTTAKYRRRYPNPCAARDGSASRDTLPGILMPVLGYIPAVDIIAGPATMFAVLRASPQRGHSCR
jgi:hypothetical protein